MPSACAVFTSAPSFSRARTASRLPLIAASTTDPPPAAACMFGPDMVSAETPAKHNTLMNVLRIVVSNMCRVGPYTSLPFCVRQHDLGVVEIELAAAVAEAFEIGAAEAVQHREHRVRHRRAVR